MKIDVLHIFEQDEDAYLTLYIRDNPPDMNNDPRGAILICPGGGYSHISNRESEPVALAFLARGYNVFVLNYSINERASDLNPACEAVTAIKHIRENAAKYNILSDKIFVLGFSAGAHVALSSAVLQDQDKIHNLLLPAKDPGIGMPNGIILCYPVVSATCPTHMGSLYNFCGTEHPTSDQIEIFSLEKHVTGATPPIFVWHTETDETVPVANSIILTERLAEMGVPYELHLFPCGYHGLSLATHETCHDIPESDPHPASRWVELADKWMRKQIFQGYKI